MDPKLNETPTALETAIEAIGAANPIESNDAPIEAAAKVETPPAEPDAPKPADGAEPEAVKPGMRMAAMLEALTDNPNTPKEAAKPATPDASTTPGLTPKKQDAETPKTAEQEEADLLEGVKSPRGQERIKQVFADKKQLETDIGEFREMVTSSGMNPQEFAQSLEFGRLVSSGNEADTRVALEMLETQRAQLYAKLGVEAPGVDLLADHADLKAQVDDMELTRERAIELAKFRKTDGDKKARETTERDALQGRQQFEQTVTTAAGQMEAYLDTRKSEVDHPARMRVISDHFRKPENLKTFIETYRPEQWGPTMKMMYDGIQLPRTAPQQQPLRSRPTNLGAPASSGTTAIDRIAQRMDSMGL